MFKSLKCHIPASSGSSRSLHPNICLLTKLSLSTAYIRYPPFTISFHPQHSHNKHVMATSLRNRIHFSTSRHPRNNVSLQHHFISSPLQHFFTTSFDQNMLSPQNRFVTHKTVSPHLSIMFSQHSLHHSLTVSQPPLSRQQVRHLRLLRHCQNIFGMR